jgi:Tol biopolymer transport system component
VIDAATGVQEDIDAGAGARSRLAWSPNGRWLAFTTEYWDQRIVASRVYGSTTRRISVSAGGDTDLDWR